MKKLILFFNLFFVVLSCFAEGVLTESQRRKIRYGIVANSPTAMDFEYGMTLEEAIQKGRYPFCITDDVEEAKDFFEWLPEYLYFTEGQTKRFFRDITEDFDYIAAAKEVSEMSRSILFEKYERGQRWAAFDANGFINSLSGFLQETGNCVKRIADIYMQEIPY